MNRRQNRSAWIWVAFAAIAFASVARAEAGLQSARTYAHPVLEFLAGNHATQAAAAYANPRLTPYRTSRQLSAASRDKFAVAGMAMLPVFFIGLVSPLNPLSARSSLCLGHTFPAPLLPSLCQRPPPSQLL
jgi:hypothetical protein